MRVFSFLIIFLLIVSISGCKEDTEKNIIKKDSLIANQSKIDSVELINLVRQVYNWHMNNEIEDFPYEYEDGQDSIFI